MENRKESITELRIKLYRRALDQLRSDAAGDIEEPIAPAETETAAEKADPAANADELPTKPCWK